MLVYSSGATQKSRHFSNPDMVFVIFFSKCLFTLVSVKMPFLFRLDQQYLFIKFSSLIIRKS